MKDCTCFIFNCWQKLLVSYSANLMLFSSFALLDEISKPLFIKPLFFFAGHNAFKVIHLWNEDFNTCNHICICWFGVDVLKKSESLFKLYSVCDVFKSMWLCPWWILEVENVKLVKVFFYFCFYFSSITALPSQTHSIGILLRIFHSGKHINQQPSFPVCKPPCSRS